MEIFKPLVTLLAIVNPVGVVPFFIHFTASFSPAQRRRTIAVSAFTAGAVIALSALCGLRIIEFFGISLASFQVGGGCLLLISSLAMLNAQPAEGSKEDVSEGTSKVDAGASIAVVPLAIPLLTGPATISTMVIYAEKTRQWWELAVLVGYGVVVGAVTWGCSWPRAASPRRWAARHQHHDPPDGPDPRGGGRGVAGGWADQALSHPGRPHPLSLLWSRTHGARLPHHHRWRRLGRLLAGQPAEPRPQAAGAADRGRGRDDYHWVHIPVGYLKCIGNSRTDWCYETEVEAGLNGRRLRYPRGKVLGGSSSINGMIYMRGQARDYEAWADATGTTPGAGLRS